MNHQFLHDFLCKCVSFRMEEGWGRGSELYLKIRFKSNCDPTPTQNNKHTSVRLSSVLSSFNNSEKSRLHLLLLRGRSDRLLDMLDVSDTWALLQNIPSCLSLEYLDGGFVGDCGNCGLFPAMKANRKCSLKKVQGKGQK